MLNSLARTWDTDQPMLMRGVSIQEMAGIVRDTATHDGARAALLCRATTGRIHRHTPGVGKDDTRRSCSSRRALVVRDADLDVDGGAAICCVDTQRD